MSSHRAGRRAIESRAAGHRRVAGATAASAVSGTALAVLFGSLFAQASAAPASAAAQAKPVGATAAIAVADADAHQAGAPTQAGTTKAKQQASGTHAPVATPPSTRESTPPSTLRSTPASGSPSAAQKAAPAPPTAAPRSAEGAPTASSGGS